MPYPNFIIVGANKSGTTSLYHYLSQHPDIFMSADKEPHYFAPAKWCGHPPMGLVDYQNLFIDSEHHSAIGEASTGYLYYPESAALIHQKIPDCRIIIMLRNPVERAFSGYSHERREGMETVSFEQALVEEKHSLRQVNGDDYSFNYVKQCIVSPLIKQYLKLFTKDQVLICLYDDLVSEPNTLMRSVFNFLKVNENFKGEWNYHYNASGLPKYQLLHDLIDGSNYLSRRLTKLFFSGRPESKLNYVWHQLRDWNINKGGKITILPKTKTYLHKQFAEEIINLESILNRDLSHWKN